jgi:hypothetical protein
MVSKFEDKKRLNFLGFTVHYVATVD